MTRLSPDLINHLAQALKPCPFCGQRPLGYVVGERVSVRCTGNSCVVKPATPRYVDLGVAFDAWDKRSNGK
jgi:hypothetical protein